MDKYLEQHWFLFSLILTVFYVLLSLLGRYFAYIDDDENIPLWRKRAGYIFIIFVGSIVFSLALYSIAHGNIQETKRRIYKGKVVMHSYYASGKHSTTDNFVLIFYSDSTKRRYIIDVDRKTYLSTKDGQDISFSFTPDKLNSLETVK